MRYHVLHIRISFEQEWQRDLFDDRIAALGVDTIDGNDYYIPSDAWRGNEQAIHALIAEQAGQVMLRSAELCPDENWNAAWEAEHPVQHLPLDVTIVPHCAFGAGHHETTSMMINQLMATDLSGKRVFDHGTGTGVLAIFAKRIGAAQVVAVDIDEHSVSNARENAILNHVAIDVRLADTIDEGPYDLIVANIHRNILLSNMPRYAASLANGGQLWLSGFYASDCEALIDAAKQQGFHLLSSHCSGEWQLLCFDYGRL